MLKGLSIAGLPGLPTPPETAVPQLHWVAIARLDVDERYQRANEKSGRENILKLARSFDWAFFAPVIVAPIEGGRFALIDGQHRATAAKLIGKAEVPAQIVIADSRKQALAFAAVNGNVTRMSSLAVFRAALGAGDPEAVSLDALARSAGVRIMGYPVSIANMKPGDCIAPVVLRRARETHGPDVLRQALLALVAQPDPRGMINRDYVFGLCLALQRLPAMADATVTALFRSIDLKAALRTARTDGEGMSLPADLATAVCARVAAIAKRGRAA